MKVNISMPDRLRPFYEQELKAYRVAMHQGNLSLAWAQLERSHILGQAFPGEHT